MRKDVEEIASLPRYWLYSNRMKELFFEQGKKLNLPQVNLHEYHGKINIYTGDLGLFHAYWYSALYVVIEGYWELGLRDKTIDSLLDKEKVRLLKLFRNGTFHFQKEYYSEKILGVDTSNNFSS
ncbi:hypothetical protein NO2_0494 [Candidatus Termititenax persephonae]|uniref:Uncharacterized protein n=1 Tax=Candidatus Termititenax persephonae TaxID=2218525 RepID=A0A388TFN5_9BACT|nr:hypothetical protein NO2_0494 [Candidatus Termititenax persephonae]